MNCSNFVSLSSHSLLSTLNLSFSVICCVRWYRLKIAKQMKLLCLVCDAMHSVPPSSSSFSVLIPNSYAASTKYDMERIKQSAGCRDFFFSRSFSRKTSDTKFVDRFWVLFSRIFFAVLSWIVAASFIFFHFFFSDVISVQRTNHSTIHRRQQQQLSMPKLKKKELCFRFSENRKILFFHSVLMYCRASPPKIASDLFL